MGFKEENYTLKGICVCIYFLVATNVSTIYGQSHCPVRVDYEPREVSQVRSANNINEVKFPFFQQWQDLNDEEHLTTLGQMSCFPIINALPSLKVKT